MDKTEIDDFKQTLRGNSHSEDDFLIQEKDLTQWGASDIVPIQGKVTVTRRSTNIKRTYNSGHGTSWVADFAQELTQGVFD